jgi:hypothetical protein
MTERRLCRICRSKWAQDGRHCRTCARAHGAQDPITGRYFLVGDVCDLRLQRRQYTPPHRDPVVLTDPLTGRTYEFEIVFDGR